MLELESGNDTFECDEISPSTANIIEVIEVEDDDVIERMAQGEVVTNPNISFSIFKNYLLTRSVADMMQTMYEILMYES